MVSTRLVNRAEYPPFGITIDSLRKKAVGIKTPADAAAFVAEMYQLRKTVRRLENAPEWNALMQVVDDVELQVSSRFIKAVDSRP